MQKTFAIATLLAAMTTATYASQESSEEMMDMLNEYQRYALASSEDDFIQSLPLGEEQRQRIHEIQREFTVLATYHAYQLRHIADRLGQISGSGLGGERKRRELIRQQAVAMLHLARLEVDKESAVLQQLTPEQQQQVRRWS